MSSSPKNRSTNNKQQTAPIDLVERERTKSGFRVLGIFGSLSSGAMVPTTPKPQHAEKPDPREALTVTTPATGLRATLPGEGTRKHKASMVSGNRTGYPPNPVKHSTQLKPQAPGREPSVLKAAHDDSSGIGIMMVLALIGLALLAGVENVGTGSADSSSIAGAPTSKTYDWEAIRESAEYHRAVTGAKLNHDRSEVEWQNNKTAPPLPISAAPVSQPDPLNGVPLAGEAPHRKNSRDRIKPLNPDYADARVMYGLQEEQQARDWESRAQSEYVKEFVANAAAAGYQVKVDKDLNVVDVKRFPQSELPPGAQRAPPSSRTGSGAAR